VEKIAFAHFVRDWRAKQRVHSETMMTLQGEDAAGTLSSQ
jgi:hypothetical protein